MLLHGMGFKSGDTWHDLGEFLASDVKGSVITCTDLVLGSVDPNSLSQLELDKSRLLCF